jgi:hypothetical protein
MKIKLLLCLFISINLSAMSDSQSRAAGMRQLQTIKTVALCCVSICQQADTCSGRKCIESFSHQVNQSQDSKNEYKLCGSSIVSPCICFHRCFDQSNKE